MRTNLIRVLAVVLLVSIASRGMAQVEHPSVFSDGMVLQQKASVPIWGKATGGQWVTVNGSWSEKKYSTRADDNGHWKLMVRTPPAGGPYELHIDDGSQRVIKDVLIGEVWLCSGQSNMNMSLNGYKDQPVQKADSIVANASYPMIRFFRVPSAQSDEEQYNCKAAWVKAEEKSVRSFSAVAYQFATILYSKLNIPVGIIQSAYGGTKAEAWMDAVTIAKFPDIIKLKSGFAADTVLNKHKPGVLYNAMIYPIAGYGIKGALWYQGESNKDKPEVYASWFTAMVKGWREQWGQGKFPFYYAQIAPYKYSGNLQAAFLREAQLKSLHTIPNSGMVVTLDIGTNKIIHPPDKTTVAQRFSYWALSQQYGLKNLSPTGPAYKKMKRDGSEVRLVFEHTGAGLSSFGKELNNFEIAGVDKIFYPATAVIAGKKEIIVKSDRVAQPVAVRYAFKDWVVGDLYNMEGLPASSFRTDDW